MKISMYILERWFHNHGYNTHSAIIEGDACLVGARITDDITQRSLACIMTKDDQFGLVSLVNGNDILFITNASGEEVLNTVNEAFEYYNAWETYLLRSAFHQSSLQELLDIANLAIMRPMLIKNNRQELCAITDSYGDHVHPNWSEYLRHADNLPARFYDPSHSYTEPTEVSVTREATVAFSPTYGGDFLYANLWTNDQRVGHICAYEHNFPFNKGDIQMMSVFQSIVNFYVSANPKVLFSLSVMDEYMSAVLNGNTKPTMLPQDVLKECIWEQEHKLVLFVMRPKTENVPQSILQEAKAELDRRIYPMYEAHVKECGVFLVNITLFRSEKLIMDILQEILDSNLFVWGVSNIFRGIGQLPVHYRAALAAMEFAQEQGMPGAQIQQAAPCLLMKQLEGVPDLDAFLTPDYEVLRSYDGENGTRYAEALFWYLFYNRNLMTVAQRMGVHRNTANKWILHIMDILGHDAYDAFYLRLSYLLAYLKHHPATL